MVAVIWAMLVSVAFGTPYVMLALVEIPVLSDVVFATPVTLPAAVWATLVPTEPCCCVTNSDITMAPIIMANAIKNTNATGGKNVFFAETILLKKR